MTKTLGFMGWVSLVFISFAAQWSKADTELSGDPEALRQFLHPRENIVSISDHAEKTAYSDKAIISLTVKTKAKLLSDALQQNASIRDAIRTELEQAGIQPDDIKNAKFSSTPDYGWFGKKPDNYEVANRVSVNVYSESGMQAVAKTADSYKEAELSDTRFEHTEKEAFQQQVKAEALTKVAAQKAFYEKQLGISLVPIGFRTFDVGQGVTRAAHKLRRDLIAEKDSFSSTPQSLNAGPPQASFDEVLYEATITVDYEIKAAK